MHVFHLPHRPTAGPQAGRVATLILWFLIVLLALMCLSARRAAAFGPLGRAPAASGPAAAG
jgi:hypothetical protein